jgi:hypothetical protein
LLIRFSSSCEPARRDGTARRIISAALVAVTLAAFALAGCSRGSAPAANTARPAPAAKAVAAPAAAAPAVAAAAVPSCAPAPQLLLAGDFADPRGVFAAGSAPFRRLETNFAAAYRAACADGVLRRSALIPPGAADPGHVRIKNAPDANVASLYLDGDEGAPVSRQHMVLEYPFLTADGSAHLPSESDLREAIFCEVQGASQQEEEASGRCLPD